MQLLMCVPLLLQMEAENQVNTANLLTATVVYNVYASYHKVDFSAAVVCALGPRAGFLREKGPWEEKKN